MPKTPYTNGNYSYYLPSQSGTVALSEFTVGDFINDGATAIAPSQNAVFDALTNKVSKTGSETIAGEKNFTNAAYFSSPSGSMHNNITLMADPFGFGFAASHDYPIIGSKNNDFSFASGKPSAMSYAASLDAKGLTANRSYAFPNQSGSIPVIRLTAPTSSIDTGVVGEMYVDNNFLYYCYSPDRWRRVATDSNWNIDE
ncbi:hypothetical protein INQ45_01705 [Flavobacterium columnare]|uniref:hypothetical protein n=1 Tax=Flavobacterium columnare TaxID=996 RepID=UPI002D205974|nr:hypothetical protein [Flavobacterium columnare]MEB3799840.1 hypothetical protein [Flavobacterium columnare]